MRRIGVVIFLSCLMLLCSSSRGQSQDDPKLTLPSSPAFSILNYEPTSVLRPTTNRALASDVLSSFDKNGRLLTNLGLEVSPYWLKSRPALTREEYLHTRNVGQILLQTLSLSAASVKDSASGDQKLGVGFRFQLIHGNAIDSLKIVDEALIRQQSIYSLIDAGTDAVIRNKPDTRDKAVAIIKAQFAILNPALSTAETAAFDAFTAQIGKDFSDDVAGAKAFAIKLRDAYMDRQAALINTIARLNDKRKGFVLEFAGASGFNSAHNNSFERAGIWLNGSRYISNTDLFTATARYMFQSRDSALSNFDLGIGYLKEAGRFNISLEAMLRWWRAEIPSIDGVGNTYTRLDKSSSYRLAAQVSCSVTTNISINLSIGKAFDSPSAATSAFFSILGFNYSLFQHRGI